MRGIGDNSGGGFDGDDPTNPYGRNGYIRVARDSRWHRIVGFGKVVTPADPERGFTFSKAEAWQDLMMECRYKSGTVLNKGISMKIEPGQLLGAISWLANRWNWTPKTVRVFLDSLERDGMIGRFSPDTASPEQSVASSRDGNQAATRINFKGNQVALVSICNYEIYQFIQRVQGQPNSEPKSVEGQANGNRAASEGQHLNKGIKERKESYSADALSAPRETNVFQLSTLSIPATMREQMPALPLPRLVDAEPAKKARKAKEAKPRTTLDPAWRLPARLGEETLDTYAVDRETILREAMRFKTWWLDKGDAKADWDATWRKWCGSKFLNWPMRPGKASLLAEDAFSRVEDAEAVVVDPWAEQRAEAARRRAEEDGA